MQSSQSDSSSERSDVTKSPQIISQPEQKQSPEHGGGRRRNEFNPDEHPEGDQRSSDRSEEEEVDRPDLELNYQGNSLVIDMSRIEWIALAIIVLSVASTIYLLR